MDQPPKPSLSTDCPLCGGTLYATGKKQRKDDGKTYFEVSCDGCSYENEVWKRDWELKDPFST